MMGLLLAAMNSCSQPPVHPVAEKPVTEKDKIEKLIGEVAELKGVTFIRKETSYDCKAAAQFMQGKWQWKSSEIKTAEDFVRVCSAGGSGEGTPYYIQYSDGTRVTSQEFLSQMLAKMEATANAGP
jgi:hypothetical protein